MILRELEDLYYFVKHSVASEGLWLVISRGWRVYPQYRKAVRELRRGLKKEFGG